MSLAGQTSNRSIPMLDLERRRRLRQAVTALVAVVTVGTAGLMWIEDWSLSRAFYFTMITVTTVGYGDEGISDAGRAFSMLLMAGGIGTATFSLGVIVQTVVAEELRWRCKMQKRIERLEGHTVLCGYGTMGRTIAAELQAAGSSVVVVDRDEARFDQACADGFLAVLGDCSEDEALRLAGVVRAGHLVAALDHEGGNIVTVLSARDLGPELVIIARAEREQDVHKLERAGADRVISPFTSGGREVANAILRPKVADLLTPGRNGYTGIGLGEVEVKEGSPLIGRRLADCGQKEADRLSFVALERPGAPPRVPARGADTLEAGDLLVVAGDAEQIFALRELARGRRGTDAA